MTTYKILLVEDEVLIADNIARYLSRKGHEIVGHAISYEEAEKLYLEKKPEIALLDIRLNGPKTGIDFAHFIQQQENSIPFIFLTSQMDATNINNAKKTFPAGYLSKPIQKESLFASIEVAMHKYEVDHQDIPMISLNDGTKKYLIPIKDILFLQVDHIYVQVHVLGDSIIMKRSPLKDLLEKLPPEQFIQSHRSYAFNIKQVSHWDFEHIFIQEKAIPVSRSRRKEVFSKLGEKKH